MNRARVLDAVGTLVRVGLAVVWLLSGGLKIVDPVGAAVAVDAYDVLGEPMVQVVAAVLPMLELALGVVVLIGVGTRFAAVVSASLLVVFLAGLGQAWARGLSIDCGCFGGGGPVQPGQQAYGLELARDLGFMVLAGWLMVRPRTRFAVDRRWDTTTTTSAKPAEPRTSTTQGRKAAGTGRNRG